MSKKHEENEGKEEEEEEEEGEEEKKKKERRVGIAVKGFDRLDAKPVADKGLTEASEFYGELSTLSRHAVAHSVR